MTHSPGQSPLQRLAGFGQSPWVDFIRRGFLRDGSLARLISADGVKGVTSNPSIFERAIAGGSEYDAAIRALLDDGQADAGAIYESLVVADIQQAADILRPVHDATAGADGFVSLEVSPYLAFDTDATIAEARALWHRVDRRNLMVKVPGTTEGAAAIRVLIEDGININVTLLFAETAYQAVAEAFIAGLEARRTRGLSVAGIHSVASFFVSRIDAMIDATIDQRVAAGDPDAAALAALRGRVAIACAKLAYRWYEESVASARWQILAAAGATPQRLLWASTGTKDRAYSDVRYVEELIGPYTVNTIPPATMDAFRDHGVPRASLTEDVAGADHVIAEAARLGLNLPGVTAALVRDGAQQFSDAADKLLDAIASKRAALLDDQLTSVEIALPAALAEQMAARSESWRRDGLIRRLWAHDAALWTNGPEAAWLGWLDVVRAGLAQLDNLLAFQRDIRAAGFSQILLIGMGGSSLGPEVLGKCFGQAEGFPALHILDSTDPQQIARFEAALDLPKTLVIVSSKSGGTLEPNILLAYFWAKMQAAVGVAQAGAHFVAVTDPGSAMQRRAEALHFRRIFLGDPAIGGRFSVLSPFGLVPAAASGINLAAFLRSAQRMVASCSQAVPPAANPGIRLGLALALAAQAGRDKLTIFAEPGIASVGTWLEQLIAESTGKLGHGIIPIDGETLAPRESYGDDRIFVHLRTQADGEGALGSGLSALAAAGHPVIRLCQPAAADIGQVFFLWEIATAVAGSVLGIDPFDQPDVEAAKIKAKALTTAYNATGVLPVQPAFAHFNHPTGAVQAFAAAAAVPALQAPTLAGVLRRHLARIAPGDYFAILAYIDQSVQHVALVDVLRHLVGAGSHAATTAQFGPRFLHSTGQLYKGGPDSGVFLQITADDEADLAVPGERYSFGVVKAAQALGDLGVLEERGRRVLHLHLTGKLQQGLDQIIAATRDALTGAAA